ncbi:MAG: hypothetical protein AAGB93_21125 [Planctomycetota bacterium]
MQTIERSSRRGNHRRNSKAPTRLRLALASVLAGAAALSTACVSYGPSLAEQSRDHFDTRPTRVEPMRVGRVVGAGESARRRSSATSAARPTRAALEASAPAQPAGIVAAGALRHVQLLDIEPHSRASRGLVRFATSEHRGVGSSRIRVHEMPMRSGVSAETAVPLEETAASLDLPFGLFAGSTWRERLPWRVLELDDELFVVAHDQVGRRLKLMKLETGTSLYTLEDCRGLEDARIRDDGIELLVRTGRGVRAVVLNSTGAVRNVHDIPTPSADDSVATFVRSDTGEPAPLEVVVAGWRAGYLVGVRFDLVSNESRSYVLEFDDPEPTRLRVAAWASGTLRRIAVGMPGAVDTDGRVLLYADDDDQGPKLLHDLHPNGSTFAETQREEFSHWQHEYGQDVRFVPDMDGDALPELAIGAPGGVLSWHVDLIAHGNGKSLRHCATNEALYRIGTNLSLDESGRYMFTGGGYVGWPESLESDAHAVLFDLQRDPGIVATFRVNGPAPQSTP